MRAEMNGCAEERSQVAMRSCLHDKFKVDDDMGLTHFMLDTEPINSIKRVRSSPAAYRWRNRTALAQARSAVWSAQGPIRLPSK